MAGRRPVPGRGGCSLVLFDRDDRPDAAAAQVSAVGRGRVRLVGHRLAGPDPGPALAAPGDADGLQQRDELRAVAVLARGQDLGDRAAPAVGGLVDLGAQPPRERPSASRPGRGGGLLSFGGAPGGSAPRAARAGPRRRAGARGPRWNPRSRSSPSPRPHRTRPAADPGSSPTCRLVTSGDASYRRSSSSRTHRAGHVTGSRSGSGTRSR